jgi:uncharacterized protein (DUF362 family)
MDLSRRELLLGGTALASPARVPKRYFGLHPFIESHPKAVFVRRTRVPHLMDQQAKLREAVALAREIFVPMDEAGVPVTDRVILKPNWTSVFHRGGALAQDWHTGTDPQFYEGMIVGLKELGIKEMHFIEANARETWNIRGLVDINDRYGVRMNECERSLRQLREGDGITWSKVPDAVVYTRIPHYAPVNEPHTWLLNIAKWKTHTMCLTLAVKNEQGLVVVPYTQFCPGWRMVTGAPEFMQPDINPRAETLLKRLLEQHSRSYGRYRSPDRGAERGDDGPMRQEIWAQKTCDNQSILTDGLSMIEGIVGMSDTYFSGGKVHLANLVMFSKHKFRLDAIAYWLGGHEPGNIHLFRIAKERGLTDTFNPWEIPVYEWVDGRAVERKLTDFGRTPLPSGYLPLPGEPEFHLCNEPFDYS